MRGSGRRLFCALAVATAILLAPAGAAQAGTARVVFTGNDERTGPSEDLDYAAAPGELNRLTTTESPGQGFLLTDEAGIQPGRECSRVASGDPTRVRCSAPTKGIDIDHATIKVGDRADVVREEARLAARVDGGPDDDDLSATGDLKGGAGNDVLTGGGVFVGGPGDDVMTGADDSAVPFPLDVGSDLFIEGRPGNGSDTIRGGSGGSDTVSYSGRTGTVRVDLEGDRDDESGENDRIGSDMEAIEGGRAEECTPPACSTPGGPLPGAEPHSATGVAPGCGRISSRASVSGLAGSTSKTR